MLPAYVGLQPRFEALTHKVLKGFRIAAHDVKDKAFWRQATLERPYAIVVTRAWRLSACLGQTISAVLLRGPQ